MEKWLPEPRFRYNYIWALKAHEGNPPTTKNNLSSQMGKTCIMQWMPAQVGIDGNEAADELAKESSYLNTNTTCLVTFDDANAISRYRLKEKNIKVNQQICEISANREITKTFTRLKTGQLGGMEINADNSLIYVKCRNCPDEELSPSHIFYYPAILASLQNIGKYSFEGDLYTEKILKTWQRQLLEPTDPFEFMMDTTPTNHMFKLIQ